MTRSLGPFAALSWRFVVRCESPVMAEHLDRVLFSLRASATGDESTYLLTSSPRSPGRLLLDGVLLQESWEEADLLAHLLWHVNTSTTRASVEYVLLHAAAAALDGRAVVLCAPMEAGKTTLVASLVLGGLEYLTDETVAMRPDDGRIVPFAKALSVDPGSWPLLAELRPHAETPEAERLNVRQWQVPPQVIRPDAVSHGALPAVIVLPRYVQDAPTTFEPISPGEAMLGVLQQTFHLDRNRRRDMETLARVLGSCSCYRLVSGDLHEARSAVRGALEQH